MSTVLKILNGTRSDDGPNLCVTCKNAIIYEFSNENGVNIVCRATDPNTRLSQKVVKCSNYNSKTSVSLGDMYEMAWTLKTDEKKRTIGFAPPKSKDKGFEDKWDLIEKGDSLLNR